MEEKNKDENSTEEHRKKEIIIYTDGACSGNPGPGAWAYHIDVRDNNGTIALLKEVETDKDTTNNRMELEAVIRALEKASLYSDENTEIRLHSDSSYVINSINLGWVESWKKKGWKNSSGKTAKNIDLWEIYLDIIPNITCKNITFIWVKGHNGNPMNEYVDKLANEAAEELVNLIKEGVL